MNVLANNVLFVFRYRPFRQCW